jgi:hypothetical protein
LGNERKRLNQERTTLGKEKRRLFLSYSSHRRMGHGFRFLLPPFLYYPPIFI